MVRSPRGAGIPAPEGFGEQATRAPATDAPRVAFSAPERLAVVDSTNRYLADLVRERRARGRPLATGYAVVAEEQTAGRGRLGRRWDAPAKSGVLCSILWRTDLDAQARYLLTWAVALATVDAVEEVAGVEAQIKWPNDVEVSGRKVAGLLAEVVSGSEPGEPADVVVGVGVNVNWPADWPPRSGEGQLSELERRATALNRICGHDVDRAEVLERLLASSGASSARLSSAAGRRSLAASFERRCATLGRPVRVELGAGALTGTARGLDAAGRLLVDSGGATHAVSAGDVVHLR